MAMKAAGAKKPAKKKAAKKKAATKKKAAAMCAHHYGVVAVGTCAYCGPCCNPCYNGGDAARRALARSYGTCVRDCLEEAIG